MEFEIGTVRAVQDKPDRPEHSFPAQRPGGDRAPQHGQQGALPHAGMGHRGPYQHGGGQGPGTMGKAVQARSRLESTTRFLKFNLLKRIFLST